MNRRSVPVAGHECGDRQVAVISFLRLVYCEIKKPRRGNRFCRAAVLCIRLIGSRLVGGPVRIHHEVDHHMINRHLPQRDLPRKKGDYGQPCGHAVRVGVGQFASGLSPMYGETACFKLKLGKLPVERLDFNFATGHPLQLGHYSATDRFTEGIAAQVDREPYDEPQQDHSDEFSASGFAFLRRRSLRLRRFWLRRFCLRNFCLRHNGLTHRVAPDVALPGSASIFSICAWERSVCSQLASSSSIRCSTRTFSIRSETSDNLGSTAPRLRSSGKSLS